MQFPSVIKHFSSYFDLSTITKNDFDLLHNERSQWSYVFKHSMETNHKMVTLDDFNIIREGYKRPKFRRKLVVSVPLKLFN